MKMPFGEHSKALAAQVLSGPALRKWRTRIPFASRVALFVKAGASPAQIQVLTRLWEAWR